MDGESKQTQTQQSISDPWKPAQPVLQGILGQLQGQLGNTGITGAETGALNSSVANANNASSMFGPQITNYAQTLLRGGGATDQAGNVNQNYQSYFNNTNPLASNTNYDPYQTPGFADAIRTATADITNNVNGAFAGAGRDFSGAHSMALGRGLASGLAPTIASQYNANRDAQQGAAGNLYGAGNTNAGILAGLQQQGLTNQGTGIAAAGAATEAQNAGNNATLQAEAARRGIPASALGLLAQIGIPIAGLGGQNSGTSQGTQQMSGAQQFATVAGGLGSLFGGGGGSTVGNIFKFISDRRAKEDITQVGALFDGTPVYRYRYIGQPAFQIGLMAQDVEKYAPEAVGQIGPFKAVDYKLATDKAVEAA
jgi:hypothetical protein